MAQDRAFLSDLKGSSLLIELFVVCLFVFVHTTHLAILWNGHTAQNNHFSDSHPIMAIWFTRIKHRALWSHQLL